MEKIVIGQRVVLRDTHDLVEVVQIDYTRKDKKIFGVTYTTRKTSPDLYIGRDAFDTDISKWRMFRR